jgi:hypothetical protein
MHPKSRNDPYGRKLTDVSFPEQHGGREYPVEEGAITQLYAANAPEAKDLSGKVRMLTLSRSRY